MLAATPDKPNKSRGTVMGVSWIKVGGEPRADLPPWCCRGHHNAPLSV